MKIVRIDFPQLSLQGQMIRKQIAQSKVTGACSFLTMDLGLDARFRMEQKPNAINNDHHKSVSLY